MNEKIGGHVGDGLMTSPEGFRRKTLPFEKHFSSCKVYKCPLVLVVKGGLGFQKEKRKDSICSVSPTPWVSYWCTQEAHLGRQIYYDSKWVQDRES